MHSFLKTDFNQLLREAVRMSRQTAGAEICGLLIDTGFHLSFVQTRNASARVGSFAFSPAEVRRVVAATKILGQEVVGTFHSHPVGVPIPGKSDIENAVENSLMFIFDCMGREGRLWRIRAGRAHPLGFGFVQRGSSSPNYARQSTPGGRFSLLPTRSARRRCAARWANEIT